MTGAYTSLVAVAKDAPGIVAKVATVLAEEKVNLATLRVSRHRKGGEAIHVYELDSPPDAAAVDRIKGLAAVKTVRVVDRVA